MCCNIFFHRGRSPWRQKCWACESHNAGLNDWTTMREAQMDQQSLKEADRDRAERERDSKIHADWKRQRQREGDKEGHILGGRDGQIQAHACAHTHARTHTHTHTHAHTQKQSDRYGEAEGVMESQDRHTELDRQTDADKGITGGILLDGGSHHLSVMFSTPQEQMCLRVTALSKPSLISSHGESSEREERARRSLCLCSRVHSGPERKVCASPWFWPWAVLLLFVGGIR